MCQAIGAVLPEGAIISDESQTSGVTLGAATAGAPRHDLLALTGGAIGQGLPVAVGAAVACPDRPVLALEADGSAMYTFQSLWTMAREQLNVTAVIFNNRSYGILNIELGRVGARASGPKARAQLDLAGPDLDFVSLAKGLGVPALRVRDGGGSRRGARTRDRRAGAVARRGRDPERLQPAADTRAPLRAAGARGAAATGGGGDQAARLSVSVRRRVYP